MNDSYSLILRSNDKSPLGFAIGYFKQYDDIVGYTLDEIVISYPYQNKGLGSFLLAELEKRVFERKASCIELQAVNDGWHDYYYGKFGYEEADNFKLRVKWLRGGKEN